MLSFDNRAWRDLASQAPYEALVLVTNSRTYGGGGIYGQFATVAADSAWARTSSSTSSATTSPRSPTSTTPRTWPTGAPRRGSSRGSPTSRRCSIRPASSGGTWCIRHALPTPWGKAAFEERSRAVQAERRRLRAERRPEAEMDRLFEAERAHEEAALGAEPWAGRVGAFEGANYEALGYFRPQADCIMFTRDRCPSVPSAGAPSSA